MDGYIPKPVSAEAFWNVLDQAAMELANGALAGTPS
jgi:hypothetical protein